MDDTIWQTSNDEQSTNKFFQDKGSIHTVRFYTMYDETMYSWF